MTSVEPGPSFLVVGAARAGSTAVAEGLRAHPDVFVTQPKEPHFFALSPGPVRFTGPGDAETINRIAVTDLDAYRALYPTPGAFLAAGEGSVSTLYYHHRSIPAIQAMNPDMRIVVILREPVQRAFSSFQYLRVRGSEPLDDFLTAVDDEPRRKELGWHHLWHYTGMSEYADAVAAFTQQFPDQVGIWFHDDLERDPDSVVADIQRFVGVDPSRAAAADNQRVNASGQPRRRAVHAAMTWATRHQTLRTTVKAVVPFRLREAIRNANLAPAEGFDDAYRALAPRFRTDLQQLEDVLDRPLPAAWRR